jgi:hypothetical protein
MALLPYCIFLGQSEPSVPSRGVQGSAVHVLAKGELSANYSELQQTEFTGVDLQQAALEYHQVVHTIFEAQAVVPFRFPTWLTPEALGEHLDQQAEVYSRFLRQHAHDVQMEIRISAGTTATGAPSGTEYLRARSGTAQRLQTAAEALKAGVADIVADWRERPLPDGLRLFALLDRKSVSDFRERLGAAEGLTPVSRVTGPWPATEFLPQPAQGGIQP